MTCRRNRCNKYIYLYNTRHRSTTIKIICGGAFIVLSEFLCSQRYGLFLDKDVGMIEEVKS